MSIKSSFGPGLDILERRDAPSGILLGVGRPGRSVSGVRHPSRELIGPPVRRGCRHTNDGVVVVCPDSNYRKSGLIGRFRSRGDTRRFLKVIRRQGKGPKGWGGPVTLESEDYQGESRMMDTKTKLPLSGPLFTFPRGDGC